MAKAVAAEVKNGKSFARRLGVEDNADFETRKLMVLREAAIAFAENGISKTSIDDIAERLGVTKPTIYHYARSKDKMIRECLRVSSEQTTKYVEELSAKAKNGRQKLEGFLRAYVHSVADDFGRLFVNINPQVLSEEGQVEYREARRKAIKLVDSFIEEGVRDGSLKVKDQRMATFALLGAFNFVGQWYHSGGDHTADEVFEGMMGVFLGGIQGARKK